MPRPRATSDEEVMAATARAIAQLGLPKLTLAAVAREAGMSPATIVQRFGSKRGLLLTFAAQTPAGARLPFTRARGVHTSPIAALRAAITGFARVGSRAELANHLTFLHMDLTDPEFLAHAQEHSAVMLGEIAALAREAVATGELGAGTDPDQLALAVRTLYLGGLLTWALSEHGPLADTLGRDLDTLLAPYLTDGSPEDQILRGPAGRSAAPGRPASPPPTDTPAEEGQQT